MILAKSVREPSRGLASTPRVLHVFYGLTTGGTERLISNLAVGLEDYGFRVTVGTFRSGVFAETITEAGGDVRVFGALESQRRLTRVLVHLRRLRSLLESGEFRIVHTHSLGILWRIFIASIPSRSWCWVHTEHIRVDVPGLYSPMLMRLAPLLLRQPDIHTCVSDSAYAYYTKTARIGTGRVHLIPNGVDLRPNSTPAERAKLREGLGIPGDCWLIGIAANFRPEKNHLGLLKALVRVRQLGRNARLLLAGEGPLLRRVQEEAQHLCVASFVHFLGARPDVPHILTALDVHCLPSRFEGMPFSVLEAMAAGCPVVASSAPGTVDVVEDGVTGLLAPIDDTEALAQQLLRIHDDTQLRLALITRARQYVAGHASKRMMLTRYADLYRELLDRESRVASDRSSR